MTGKNRHEDSDAHPPMVWPAKSARPGGPGGPGGPDGQEPQPARSFARKHSGWLAAAGVLAVMTVTAAATVVVNWSSFGSPAPSAKGVSATRKLPTAETFALGALSASPSMSASATASRTVSTAKAGKPTHSATATPTGPTPVGAWLLNTTSGNTVADTTGLHPGTATNVGWAQGSGLAWGVFGSNGVHSDITTDGPVINTGSSFTVSAWVYLFNTSAYYTAVSQDSTLNSNFYLQYSAPDNRWAFVRVGASGRALSSSAPVLDTWTHLVGVYDAGAGQIRLYVGGTLESTETDSAAVTSTGDLVIGRAWYNNADADWFYGSIRDVEVFDTALTAAQIGKI